ncbi:MAG: DUF5050 domain-containing protein, partial [Desulfosporosinus sp.]|nr:DUF5050 domain-containing protein [Desulfosporosinus sp.]
VTEMVGEDAVSHTQGIYKIKTDGTGKTEISNNDARFLMLSGDWLYYSNQSDNGKIYRIKTDGSGKMKLNDDTSFHLNTDGNWIYYLNHSDNNKLYRVRMDGTDREKLSDNAMNKVVVDGGYIYYTTASLFNQSGEDYYGYFTTSYNNSNVSIYRMNTDGTNVTMLQDLTNLQFFTAFNVCDGNVYYITDSVADELYEGEVYSLPGSGLGSSKLISHSGTDYYPDRVYISGGAVYDVSGTTYLYKLDEGSCEAKLVNGIKVY